MAVRVVPMEIKSSATQLDNCAITVRRHRRPCPRV